MTPEEAVAALTRVKDLTNDEGKRELYAVQCFIQEMIRLKLSPVVNWSASSDKLFPIVDKAPEQPKEKPKATSKPKAPVKKAKRK